MTVPSLNEFSTFINGTNCWPPGMSPSPGSLCVSGRGILNLTSTRKQSGGFAEHHFSTNPYISSTHSDRIVPQTQLAS